jgi:hypothetical protein
MKKFQNFKARDLLINENHTEITTLIIGEKYVILLGVLIDLN